MPRQYRVQQGDCISSIAAKFGLLFDTVWNDSGNADLKQRRPDPNVLYPGDMVAVPDRDPRLEDRGTDSTHRFTKKDESTYIKLRFLLDGQPRSGLDYEIQVEGRTATGQTDGDGCLREAIPPLATQAMLTLGTGSAKEIYPLALGTLDPIDTDDGVRKRLASLGYDTQDLPAACNGFRAKEGMPAEGGMDDSFRAKLKEKFGQ